MQDELNELIHENNELRCDLAIIKAENATLRAAVAEMEKMLPVLEIIEIDGHGWSIATKGTEIYTLNAYRQTLEAALPSIPA